MPLSLHIEADTAAGLIRDVSALAVALGAAVASQPRDPLSDPIPDPKPATRSSKKSSASGSDATGDASGAAGATATASAEQVPAGEVTKEQVAALCNQYGAKAGATALQEIFKNEMGSPQGKFSGVTADKYPALAARLTELLAAA